MTANALHHSSIARLSTCPAPLPWTRAVALHLAPGVALLAFFGATAPLLRGAGLPPVWGLMFGTLLVLAPIELSLVIRSARRRGETRFLHALGLKPIRRRDLGPMLLTGALSTLLPGLVIGLEPVLHSRYFDWLPDWFTASVPNLSTYSTPVAAATVALWLITLVLVGPAVEEIYFRGWLLPRLKGGRLSAAAANAALFSVYHLWQPYAVVTVFLFALPLAVLARTRHNPALSIAAHCAVNLLAFAALTTGLMQR